MKNSGSARFSPWLEDFEIDHFHRNFGGPKSSTIGVFLSFSSNCLVGPYRNPSSVLCHKNQAPVVTPRISDDFGHWRSFELTWSSGGYQSWNDGLPGGHVIPSQLIERAALPLHTIPSQSLTVFREVRNARKVSLQPCEGSFILTELIFANLRFHTPDEWLYKLPMPIWKEWSTLIKDLSIEA